MVMQSVSLFDTLTLTHEPGEGMSLSTNLGFLPLDGRNLAVKAALVLQEATGADLGHLSIKMEKRIPVCAGTAGGSSDAAAVLRGLNELLSLGLTPEELAEIGKGVGSDVPYCVLGGTALAEGRGEKITPLPALPPCWVVMVKPDFPVSTPQLFAKLGEKKLRCHPDTAGMLAAIESGDLSGVARRLFNVFEEVLPPKRQDRIEELKQALLDGGAMGASMTGTGPTVFGLFDREDRARETFGTLNRYWRETFLVRTL
ncbi:MAG: 4-(cytidine 5'-diphospho)-2-C-methyl-D-erythritol kinase, partial [Oscillospiraceae bacterium]|nr:4-(cytidine 5'-diphospho)-2-C-methyl-D-erythritol kinase [Oscillospiraceae bacterium]